MTPLLPVPVSQVIICGVCKAQLFITAVRNDASRTSTRLTISCPACKKEAEAVVPLSIIVSSVQIHGYERPAKEAPPKHAPGRATTSARDLT
jgi:hypothetical protein